MTHILDVARQLLASIELAENAIDTEQVEAPSLEEQTVLYLTACLVRANKLLDKHKTEVFAQVLNLPSVSAIERAVIAYDKPYLLSLGLSLESTVELADELILTAKRRGIEPSKAWREVSEMNIDLGQEAAPVVSRKRPAI